MESEKGNLRRRKGGLSTQAGILIGVAGVAGLGLAGKFLSMRRYKKPQEPKDAEIEVLEAVVNGEPAKHPPPILQRARCANMENQRGDQVLANGKNLSGSDSSGRSNRADFFSEALHPTDVLREVGDPMNQDREGKLGTVGVRDSDNQGKEGVENEKAITRANLGEESSSTQKKSRRNSSENLKRGRKSKVGGNGTKSCSLPESKSLPESSTKSLSEAVDDDKDLVKSLTSLTAPQRKNSGHNENHPRDPVHHELVRSALDTFSKCESINGYKVFLNGKEASSEHDKQAFTEALDEFKDALSETLEQDVVMEFKEQRENFRGIKRSHKVWKSKNDLRNQGVIALSNGESQEVCKEIVSPLISSASDVTRRANSVRLRKEDKEDKSMRLSPSSAPKGNSVHLSNALVKGINEGVKVEESAEASRPLPMSGESESTRSDQQNSRTKSVRERIPGMLPLLIRFVAVLIALCCFLFVLLSQKRIPLPHLSFAD